ncbi:amino acid/polyamine transporter I [Xylariaceae sp. FL1651]|nr:amino acid/polyamine transporter I [Xylariaceae sp. FL1651]
MTGRSASMSRSRAGPLGNASTDSRAEEHMATAHSALLRRSTSGDDEPRPRRRKEPPTLTRLNGLALVIGLQIGSGIFSAPSLISRHVRSPAEGLGVFAMAGLLVWTGAASFIELGLRVPPSNGGIQEYLRASWGEYVAHLFAWTWFGVAKPAGNAVIATIFAEYLLSTLWWPSSDGPILPWATKIVALSCVATLTVINCVGTTAGAKAANVFLLLKLCALGSIILIGLATYVFGDGEGVPASEAGWFGWDRATVTEPSIWESLGSFSTAVFAALFCYGGWENIGFVLGDMEDPGTDLPAVINGAMALVIIGFFLMNAALYICLPFDIVRESTTVAVEFARRTIGPWGGLVLSLMVSISAMGAVNANMFAVAKLCVAASQRAYFPSILANLHCCTARDEAAYFHRALPWPIRLPIQVLARLTRKLRWEQAVPIFALLLHGILTSVFVLIGSFSGLITLIEIIKSCCFMMSVLGIFMLRRAAKQKPSGSHPKYITWMGNPIIFASVSGLLIIRGALSAPLQGPVILFISILGLAVLYRKFGSRGYEIAASV